MSDNEETQFLSVSFRKDNIFPEVPSLKLHLIALLLFIRLLYKKQKAELKHLTEGDLFLKHLDQSTKVLTAKSIVSTPPIQAHIQKLLSIYTLVEKKNLLL